jgi:subfamily B ATP-binding cassette protein MsbA
VTKGPSLLARAAQVTRLAAPPPWAGPAMLAFGFLSAALEGAGLYLFIPLVQALGAQAPEQGAVSDLFSRLLEPVPRTLWIPVLVAGLCASIIAKNLTAFAGNYLARRLDGEVAHRLRVRLFDQTLASCIDYRVSNRITDLVTTLTGNTWKVSHALSLVYRLIVCAASIAVFLALLAALSLRLTLMAVVMLTAAAALVQVLTRRAQQVGKAVVEENKQFGLRMWESMSALQLIRSFGREAHEVGRFERTSERMRRRLLRLDVLWGIPGPVSEVCGALLIGVLILVGVRSGAGLGALAAFLAVLYRAQGPTREFLQCKVAMEGLAGAIDDVDEALAQTAKPYLASGSRPVPPLAQGLEFRGVGYRYAEDEAPALDGLSFTIPAGKTTAVVGRSGAGKSTLMSLIFRFRDPTAGEILADGAPLRDLDLAAWRARLSLMAQQAQLFNETVAANIGYGRLDATRREIQAAAEVAGAHEFIATLPQGYDTELGDRGARLSGGQAQRIALARAILRAPDLLLLDEPTNSLDAETEQAFQAALQTFSRGRTVVVIAHRLSTVRGADHVVVLDGGQVVEMGSPAELLARPGRFARLYGLQTRGPDQREVA